MIEPTSDATIERDTFRAVMRRQAASVTIITTNHDAAVHGMTATAFTSVCADPPTILIVINRSARSHPLIDRSGIFAVNILEAGQAAIAKRFSGKLDDQFDGVPFAHGVTGAPIIDGASAYLECRISQRIEVETHTLFVGRVIAGATAPGEPLIYHEGAYAGLRPLE